MGKNTDVYVETSALESWGAKMSSINSNAVTNLNDFISTVGDLEESWVGASASSFLRETDSFVASALNMHEKMQDVEKFLDEVIIVMENH